MMIISERMLARQVELRQDIKRLKRIKCPRCAQARLRKLARLMLSQYENANYEGVLGALADSFGITMEELPKQRDRAKEAIEACQLAKYWVKPIEQEQPSPTSPEKEGREGRFNENEIANKLWTYER